MGFADRNQGGSSGAVAWPRAAHYIDFGDAVKFPTGTTISDGVTLPQIGSAIAWKSNDVVTDPPVVANGLLWLRRNGGGYFSAEGTPATRSSYSMAFGFVRVPTRHASATSNNFLTITVGSAPLTSGGTHNAWGNWHVNVSENGIVQKGLFGIETYVTVDAAADTLTLGAPVSPGNVPNPPVIETGDFVQVGAASYPGGLAQGVGYYAIRISGSGNSGVYKLATTRANALAGSAIDITTAGTTVTLYREFEPTNRTFRSNFFSWLPDKLQSRLCSGSSSTDIITTTVPHSFLADTPITFEGNDLPAPLVNGTVYFARDITSSGFKVAATRGGAAIDLTTNGSASQYVRGLDGTLAPAAMPYNRQSIITFTFRGDYVTVALVGVGEIEFYFRNIAEVMASTGAVGYYYQTPPEQGGNGAFNYHSIWPLEWALIDAPDILDIKLQQHAAYVAALAVSDRHELPGRLTLQPANGGVRSTMVNLWSVDGVRDMVAGYSTKAFGSSLRPVGGNRFAEGLWLSNPYFTDAGASLAGVAPASIQGLDGSVSSAAASSETNILNIASHVALETGDTEEHILCGTLVGANAKRLRITYQSLEGNGDVFDSNVSGTPLNALSGPWMLRIERKTSATHSHQTYAWLTIGGTVIGPQRQNLNMSGGYRNMVLRTTTADAGGIVCDHLRTTVHRVKPLT